MNIFRQFIEKSKYLVFTLRFSILTIFISFFVIAMLTLTMFTYYRFAKSINYFSFKIMRQASDSAFMQVVNEMHHIELKSKSVAHLIELNVVKPGDFSQIKNYTTNFMENEADLFPSVESIFWGDTQGNFVMAEKEFNNTILSDIIDRSIPHATRMLIYRDKQDHIIKTINSTNLNYDPRLRPWFQAAKTTQHTIWSGVYPYRTSGLLGITVTTPIYTANNTFKGAINFNVQLDYLRQLIQKIKLTKNSIIFIVTSNGDLIAYPNLVQYRNHATIENINSLTHVPWVVQSFDEYQQSHQQEFRFRYNGQDYIASYRKLSRFEPEDWLIGVVVPISDFIGELRNTQILTAVISAIVLICSIIIVSRVITRVVNPLNRITSEIGKIKNFDLDDTQPIHSRIKEVSFIADALFSMKKGLRAFQKYVPATLVRQLIESGEDARIGGVKKSIAILFSDITDFTAIAEQTDPELLTQHLCAYFEEVSAIIISHRGTIDKYIGDAIMAFWGAPLQEDQASQQAVRAAVDCIKRLRQLNTEWLLAGKPVFLTRFGIHLGEAIVGNMGSTERLNYTAIGDAINMASRLESINKFYGTQIIISDTIYPEVKDQYLIRMLDYITLKGKTEPHYIYELIPETRDQLNYDIDAYNQHFSHGFSAYQTGAWDDAINYFNTCLHIYPDDKVAMIFIHRCRKFKQSSVSKNWKGVWVFNEK